MAKSLVKVFKAMKGPPLRKGKEVGGSTFYLPTELWLEIIGHIADKHTLICLTQVNRVLQEIAEPTLYNAITLRWDATKVTQLRRSIHSCPRRARYVFKIILTQVGKEIAGLQVRDDLPSLLKNLQSLRHLHIEEIPRPPGTGDECCTALASVCLPELSTLVVRTESPFGILLDFLAAHQKVQEIDLRCSFIHIRYEPLKLSGGTSLSALRTLTCDTPLLNAQPPIPPNLSHLYRRCFWPSHLPLIAAHAGPQLVSLKFGDALPFQDFQPWSLLDVVSKFPRLRFLQVHMGGKVRIHLEFSGALFSWICYENEQIEACVLDTRLIDWYQRRPAWFRPDLNDRPQITLAWTYMQNIYSSSDDEAGWDRYLEDGALQVLQEWGDCVERVVYGVDRRYISTTLGTDGVERKLVKMEDRNMHEDYWKYV